MRKDLPTFYAFGGNSGCGKSTRVYALVQFLKKNYKPEIVFLNRAPIGFRFFGNLVFVGKEINRGRHLAWQGLDIMNKRISSNGQDGLYQWMFEQASKESLVIETAVLLRTHRSRPLYISQTPYIGNFNVRSRFYFYDSFEDFQKRIYDRQDGKILTEKSTMWNANSQFRTYTKNFNKELLEIPEEHRDLFFCDQGKFDEPVWSLGEIILTQEGKEDLIPAFKEFCEKDFFIKNASEFKRNTLF